MVVPGSWLSSRGSIPLCLPRDPLVEQVDSSSPASPFRNSLWSVAASRVRFQLLGKATQLVLPVLFPLVPQETFSPARIASPLSFQYWCFLFSLLEISSSPTALTPFHLMGVFVSRTQLQLEFQIAFWDLVSVSNLNSTWLKVAFISLPQIIFLTHPPFILFPPFFQTLRCDIWVWCAFPFPLPPTSCKSPYSINLTK